MIKIGDLVTRKSYNNDLIFKVVAIDENIAYLIGVDYRLSADSSLNDLIITSKVENDDDEYIRKVNEIVNLDRSEYFYIPGKILHIDSDKNYLDRCLKLYKEAKVNAYGIRIDESDVAKRIQKLIEEVKPNIIVITGHDAYYKEKSGKDNYKNSQKFIEAVKTVRKIENDNRNLVIIAGACQSNYEELIKAGATFASSPKRINIHALDPAIIAISLSLCEKGKEINLIELLKKTKYGKDGIGGLKTNGMMYVGYPRE